MFVAFFRRKIVRARKQEIATLKKSHGLPRLSKWSVLFSASAASPGFWPWCRNTTEDQGRIPAKGCVAFYGSLLTKNEKSIYGNFSFVLLPGFVGLRKLSLFKRFHSFYFYFLFFKKNV